MVNLLHLKKLPRRALPNSPPPMLMNVSQMFGLVLRLRKFVHTSLPQVGFALGSLRPQASVLPFVSPLLVADIINVVGMPYALDRRYQRCRHALCLRQTLTMYCKYYSRYTRVYLTHT